MLYILGQPAEITTKDTCLRSSESHVLLREKARSARKLINMDVENSFVLCLRCGKAISLNV